MRPDLQALTVFLTVAETRNFRAASERLGVTRSAVSQAIKRLEAQMGIALVTRTTRSVNLTEAGIHLYRSTAPAMAEIDTAYASTDAMSDHPRGQLRLAVSSIAERFVAGPLLASFAALYPDVQIDILVTDEEFDIVARGFDAAVRLGEVIEQDMIAVPVSGDQRQLAVCAPRSPRRGSSSRAGAGTPIHSARTRASATNRRRRTPCSGPASRLHQTWPQGPRCIRFEPGHPMAADRSGAKIQRQLTE